jgi:hypothetical protein
VRPLAVVILVAVTISIVVAGVAWIVTTMHSMMWRPEILRITNLEMGQLENGTWVLKIEATNVGEARAEIYKIEIVGVEEVVLNPPLTIEAGVRKQLQPIPLTKSYHYYTMYTIRLYLKSGTVYHYIEYRVAPK